MKLLYFIAGVITGIVGVNLYGIFVQPTLPSEDWNPNWSEYLEKTHPKFFAYLYRDTMDRDPDDTQPVKVR